MARTQQSGTAPLPRPTLHHVAALAGVSPKTVSRVMNGERHVAAKTIERVWEAAKELDYQPDMLAGNLRRGDRRTETLGLMISSVDNPFASAIHRGVEDVARLHSTAVLASSIDDDAEREREVVTALTRRRVDALIVTPTAESQAYLGLQQDRGTPFVFVDREPVGVIADSVTSDHVEGAARATRHLLDRGHRRIAFLGDLPGLRTTQARRRGYGEALSRVAKPDERLVVTGLHDAASACSAALELLRGEDPPTAIFSGQNLITIGVVHALRELGLQRDIALIGFDDVTLGDLLDPGLSVIAQDAHAIGRVAAEQAFARLAGDESPVRRTVIPTRLIERGSGEIVLRS